MNIGRFLFLFIALIFTTSSKAQEAQNGFGIIVGANYSDVNYGSEFLDQYLPLGDYESFSSSGEGFYAYDVGLQYSRVISNKFSTSLGLIYSVLNYKIDGEVSNLKPEVMRPPSSLIPVSVDGVVKYSFMNFQLGLNYSFNQTASNGLFITATLNSMLPLNTNWYLNVINEDQSEQTDKDITGMEQPDYKTLWFIGLGIGYHIRLGENLSLTPAASMKYGLNPLVEGTLEPTVINLEVTITRWF